MSNVTEVNIEFGSKSMACIEDLSNEVFYEIFEYLNGCHIYDAFLNLNIRFQNLLTYSSQPLKIDLCEKQESMTQYYCRTIIIPNQDQIISIRLSNICIMENFVLASFIHLESLVINGMNACAAILFLQRCNSLPRLFSITLESTYDMQDPETIYQWLFRLPVLKYCKVSLIQPIKFWESPCLTDDRCISSIEHLVIDHERTINELFRMLLHTPRLSHLTCKSIQRSMKHIQPMSFNLPNLKYISINNDNASFDEFEVFFTEIHSPIQILHFKTPRSINYIDAKRWERLILHYMPHLHTFYLQCSIHFHDEFRCMQEHEKSNGFISSFWIERRWIVELKIDVNQKGRREMIYLIHPYRKDYSHQSTQLTLTSSCSVEGYQRFIDDHGYLFNRILVDRLNIDNSKTSPELLIKLLHILPNITSLSMSSLSMDISKSNDLKKTSDLDFVSNNNTITKVYLEKIDELTMIQFIRMNICHHVEYFEISCAKNVNIKMILCIILKKYAAYVPHLRSLSLCMTKINDKMIEQLQIDLPNFLNNYTIQYTNNKLCLQWK